MTRISTIGGAVAALLACSGVAFAQTPQEQAESSIESFQRSDARPVYEVEDDSFIIPEDADKHEFELVGITFGNADRFTDDEMRALYAKEQAKDLITVGDLYRIAERVRNYYRESGYVLTRVLVPQQTIRRGQPVQLLILEAVIDKVTVQPEPGVSKAATEAVRRIVKQLENQPPPHIDDIERALLLANDVPGVTRATAIPSAGSAQAASRAGASVSLTVVLDHKPIEGRLYVDNRQSPIVGSGFYGVLATANSYTARADTTTLGILGSWGYESSGLRDFEDRISGLLAHSTQLSTSGLVGHFEVLYSQTRPSDTLLEANIAGKQFSAEVELEYPIMRTSDLSIWASAGTAWTDTTTDISNGAARIADDHLRVVFARARLEQNDEYGRTSARVEVRQGLDVLGASDAGDPNLGRADGSGKFLSVRLDLERTLELDDEISLALKAAAQLGSRPLLGSEEFSLGSNQFGRGYDPAEITGDSGLGGSAELRYDNAVTYLDMESPFQLYGFLDFGQTYNLNTTGAASRRTLFSTGAGIRLSLPHDVSVEFEVAKPLDPVVSRRNDKQPSFYFRLQKDL